MLKYTIKRLLQLIPILFAASILIFALVRISPSDPIASMTKGKKISAETRQALEKNTILTNLIRSSTSSGLPTPSAVIWEQAFSINNRSIR